MFLFHHCGLILLNGQYFTFLNIQEKDKEAQKIMVISFC